MRRSVRNCLTICLKQSRQSRDHKQRKSLMMKGMNQDDFKDNCIFVSKYQENFEIKRNSVSQRDQQFILQSSEVRMGVKQFSKEQEFRNKSRMNSLNPQISKLRQQIRQRTVLSRRNTTRSFKLRPSTRQKSLVKGINIPNISNGVQQTFLTLPLAKDKSLATQMKFQKVIDNNHMNSPLIVKKGNSSKQNKERHDSITFYKRQYIKEFEMSIQLLQNLNDTGIRLLKSSNLSYRTNINDTKLKTKSRFANSRRHQSQKNQTKFEQFKQNNKLKNSNIIPQFYSISRDVQKLRKISLNALVKYDNQMFQQIYLFDKSGKITKQALKTLMKNQLLEQSINLSLTVIECQTLLICQTKQIFIKNQNFFFQDGTQFNLIQLIEFMKENLIQQNKKINKFTCELFQVVLNVDNKDLHSQYFFQKSIMSESLKIKEINMTSKCNQIARKFSEIFFKLFSYKFLLLDPKMSQINLVLSNSRILFKQNQQYQQKYNAQIPISSQFLQYLQTIGEKRISITFYDQKKGFTQQSSLILKDILKESRYLYEKPPKVVKKSQEWQKNNFN